MTDPRRARIYLMLEDHLDQAVAANEGGNFGDEWHHLKRVAEYVRDEIEAADQRIRRGWKVAP
jgi:hypothetical protein